MILAHHQSSFVTFKMVFLQNNLNSRSTNYSSFFWSFQPYHGLHQHMECAIYMEIKLAAVAAVISVTGYLRIQRLHYLSNTQSVILL